MLYRRLVRGLLVLAALLALGGALAPAVASVVSTRYRVWEAFPLTIAITRHADLSLVARRPAGRDPWGRPWAVHAPAALRAPTVEDAPLPRSPGPDGVDDRGLGDDVVVDPGMQLVALAPDWGPLVALLVLWVVAVLRALAGGRGPALWHDVLRAAVAASPLTVAAVVVVAAVGVPRGLRELPLVVPVELAVIGAMGLVATLAALGWRVRRGVPRRERARLGAGLVAAAALLGACVASLHGLAYRIWSHNERQPLLRARLGARAAIDELLRDDDDELDAYLALEPDVEWQRLSSEALLRLASRGPRSTPALVRALRWSGHAATVEPVAWRLVLAQDVELQALAAALAEAPDRYTGLLLTRPTLVAALLGAERARAALRPLERHVVRAEEECPPFEPAAVYPEQAAELRRRAGEAQRLLAGADDAWVLVRVRGLARNFGQLRCGSAVDGGAEVVVVVSDGGDQALVVLGPLPAAPGGRRLVVRDLVATERALTVELPAQWDHETLWVEACVSPGASYVRPLAR